jgi:hypothetical protein
MLRVKPLVEPTETSFWTWIAGIAGAVGIGGFGAWYFSETLKALLQRLRLMPMQIVRRVQGRDVPSAPGTHFTVVIADLDGDDPNLGQTKHVEAALRDQQGLEVVRVRPGPKPFETGSRVEHQIRTEGQAREMLARHNGDLLIWGEVAQANLRVRLRFLPRQEGIEGKHASYQLEAAELPKDFGDDFNAQLIALALASLAPATEQEGRYAVDLLKQPAQKLERLLEHGPPGLDRDQIAGLRVAYGSAARAIGAQTGDANWLQRAISAFTVALEAYPHDRVPLKWAAAQRNLGNALALLG